MVYNTGETDEQLRNEYNPEGSHLRKVQLRMLDMLLYLDDVCKEIGIQYRLDGGTLLGAVRHKGFIPWDDDLDIAIDNIEDWKRLADYLKKKPHPQYHLQDDTTDPGMYKFWMTIRDEKSEYIHQEIKEIELEKPRKYKGLQIDIFPFRAGIIPSLYRFCCFLQEKQSKLVKYKFLADSAHKLQKFIIHPFCKIQTSLFGNKNLYMHDYGAGWTHRFSNEVLFPYTDYTFEGHTFKGPASSDEYLKQIYGNYMDLPNRNNRNQHKVFIKIWD